MNSTTARYINKPAYKKLISFSVLAVWLLMGVLTSIHNQDHAVQQDAQCALCTVSVHLDHGMSSSQMMAAPIYYLSAVALQLSTSSSFLRVASKGNRDPPE